MDANTYNLSEHVQDFAALYEPLAERVSIGGENAECETVALSRVAIVEPSSTIVHSPAAEVVKTSNEFIETLKLSLAIIALAIGAFVLAVGVEIVLLRVLNMIGFTMLALTVALAGVVSLLAPFGLVFWFNFTDVVDLFSRKVQRGRILVQIVVATLVLALWTIIAKELAFGASSIDALRGNRYYYIP